MRSFKYDIEGVAKALLKAEGITSGYWALGFSFQFRAMGIKDKSEDFPAPGVQIRLSDLRLDEVDELKPGAVDASQLETEPQ